MQLTKEHVFDKFIVNPDTKKCFIFDLDGTIIFKDAHLCTENEKLLRRIKNAGHEVAFASGRPLRDFRLLMPEWTHESFMALFGGAMSLRNNVILNQTSIAKEVCMKIVEFCVENNYPFVIDDHLYYYHPETGHEFYDYIDNSIVGGFKQKNLQQMLDNEIYKIFILDDEPIEKFTEMLNGTNLAIHRHSKFKSFDILPCGVNKYNGVMPFLNYASNDVFVFGDDLNDYELFLNFHNSTLFGEHKELELIAKLNIPQNAMRQVNFAHLINTILQD